MYDLALPLLSLIHFFLCRKRGAAPCPARFRFQSIGPRRLRPRRRWRAGLRTQPVRLHEHALRGAAAGDHLPAERHARTLTVRLHERRCICDSTRPAERHAPRAGHDLRGCNCERAGHPEHEHGSSDVPFLPCLWHTVTDMWAPRLAGPTCQPLNVRIGHVIPRAWLHAAPGNSRKHDVMSC
jgi:hypothetical protein